MLTSSRSSFSDFLFPALLSGLLYVSSKNRKYQSMMLADLELNELVYLGTSMYNVKVRMKIVQELGFYLNKRTITS